MLQTEGCSSISIKLGSGSECSLSRLAKSKKAEFIGVIEHFFDERNADNGHYGQTNYNFMKRLV